MAKVKNAIIDRWNKEYDEYPKFQLKPTYHPIRGLAIGFDIGKLVTVKMNPSLTLKKRVVAVAFLWMQWEFTFVRKL